ncbi:MAG: single-stranded DNA-binding protein [Mogibacterium sp.]|nr:single-stranded DNA-binding protein [Mogibacterium sp.]
MNSINIIGRLTREPELKTLTSGTSALSGTIAYNERVKGEEVSMFFDFTAYGRTAELIDQYCHKGEMVALTGKLQQRTYTARDGSEKKAIEILVNEMTLLPKEKKRGEVANIVKEDLKEQARNKLGDIDKFATVELDTGDLPF